MSRKSGLYGVGVLVAGVLGVIILITIVAVAMFRVGSTETHYGCVVTDKDSVTMGEDTGNQYRVYTENCGVFSVEDEALKMRFDSADVYSKIKVGETYNFETIGWRIPLVSSFPNILFE